MIVFLDFDGVLHPDNVYLTREGPTLKVDGRLFMWADILSNILSEFPTVEIVLSTSWVRNIGYEKAKKRLLPMLKSRVVGSTWQSSMAKEM